VSESASIFLPFTGLIKNSAANPVDVSSIEQLDHAVTVVDCEPSPFQKITGTYRKAHVKIHGLPITIENPRGSVRSKQKPDGKVIWACRMPAHYGYIKRTLGADGDQLDLFIGEKDKSHFVYIVTQVTPNTGAFDELKCFLWFNSAKKALRCYDASFSDGSGPDRRKGMSGMDIDSFKKWLKTNKTAKEAVKSIKAFGWRLL
jgi:hypothetical protein